LPNFPRMNQPNKFYLTSPIFYPNAKLHMGHAYTMTLCDILARYQRLENKEVYFLTGSDENTGKVVRAAKEANKSIEEFLTEINKNFENLYKSLNISYDQFIRTTDKEKHWPGAIALWNKLVETGDIYKSIYRGLYCPSCEVFYTGKDLVDGKCPYHMTILEGIEEENYFFRLSKYTETVKEKIKSDKLRVIPETRKNEILALLEQGLEDISFSRPIENVPHGIPVPGDSTQVIYVWCDALVNYISAIGYGRDETELDKWWPANLHVIGKDILRFHAAIWPAMLLSAGLPLPNSLLVHGFITSGGHKMSKSIGNIIDPLELIEKFGPEAVRYVLARKISTFEDGDLTTEAFKDAYNGDLANGLGNLVSRIMKLAETHLSQLVTVQSSALDKEIESFLDKFEIQKAMNYIWSEMGELDAKIQKTKPWESKDKGVIADLVLRLSHIAYTLAPFMPQTSEKILEAIKDNRLSKPLFPRKDA